MNAPVKTAPPRLVDPMAPDMGSAYGLGEERPGNLVSWQRPPVGPATDQAMAQIVTAQNCGIKRNMIDVINRVKSEAAAAGMKFCYRIPFKDRKTNSTTYVEGPTINCAMAVARLYGNCTVQTDVRDTGDTWVFASRFIDYETGFSLTRLFQQRKSQSSGMKDADRQLDIIFQIGQSKAIRNVIVAALETICDLAKETAKQNLLERVGKNPDAARKWILTKLVELEVALPHVERVYATKSDKWTAPQMAKLYQEINSILDGMAMAEDLWPTNEMEADSRADATKADLEREAATDQQPAEQQPKETAKPAARKAAPKPAAQQQPREPEPADDEPPPPSEEDEPGQGDMRFA